MNARFVTAISIASIALLSGCVQPNQSSLPGAAISQAAASTRVGAPAIRHARFIYFAGIQASDGGAGGFLGPGELGVYPVTANGDEAPLHVIVGKNTGLFEGGGCCVPQSAWFDTSGNAIWTCRTFSNLVSRFSTNQGSSSWGDVKPSETLVISRGTVSCGGVALNLDRDIVADDINQGFVATWRSGSAGSSAPIRLIAGPATKLFHPSQIAFDGRGDYVVSDRCRPPKCSDNGSGGEILFFDARANGNAAPLRVLAGSKTKLSEPGRVTYDATHDMIYVANLNSSTITGFPAGASGNIPPSVFIHGEKTQLFNPDAIAIDADGYLYVGNEPIVPGPPPASIEVFAPGADGNVAPVQIIQGSKTKLAEVNGLSVH